MSRPPLTNHQIAARARGKRMSRARWLCDRLDSYVAKAEAMKPQTKGRADWLALADEVRAELKTLDH